MGSHARQMKWQSGIWTGNMPIPDYRPWCFSFKEVNLNMQCSPLLTLGRTWKSAGQCFQVPALEYMDKFHTHTPSPKEEANLVRTWPWKDSTAFTPSFPGTSFSSRANNHSLLITWVLQKGKISSHWRGHIFLCLGFR